MSAFTFPLSDGPELRGVPALRWGIIGTGNIAGDFSDALHRHTAQRVVAVTSRSAEAGERFIRTHGADRAFTDAQQMAAHPDVDVVYVATPHSLHLAGALAAITAGKPVLIEKPLALTAAEAEQIAKAAQESGVFAAEAMWTRYQPGYRVLAQLIEAGDLGDLVLAHAEVGWKADLETPGRMLDPQLGGGALLDMGVYSLWFAQFAIGHPISLRSHGLALSNGVDLSSVALLEGSTGALATATSTLLATTDGIATIVGTAATVRFVDHFVFPGRFAITMNGETTVWEDPIGLTGRAGLAHEAVAIAELIGEGRTHSPLHSLDDSVALARTIDVIRSSLRTTDLSPGQLA